jgi:hypothetical protein
MQSITFSDNTLSVLKNFSSINQSILFRNGNILSTISPSKTIIAYSEVETEFTSTFGIYDLPQFLSALSLFKHPSVDIHDRYLEIVGDSKNNLRYSFCDPSLILSTPENKIKFPSADVEFYLPEAVLQNVLKAAGILGFPNVSIVGDGKNIVLKTLNAKADNTASSDVYSVEVGETDRTFNAVLNVENFKFINGDYNVQVSSKGISRFTGPVVEYYVVVDSNLSKFD